MNDIGGYIIFHPPRKKMTLSGGNIFFDNNDHNQDPYIWNKQFLHSTCHMTELTAVQKCQDFSNKNFVLFWVSGRENQKFKELIDEFTVLNCDLVFVVDEKINWNENTLNHISIENNVVDSKEAYMDHYFWVPVDHPYTSTNYGRFTLKADANESYQPQTGNGELINILDIITKVKNCSPEKLKEDLKKGNSGRSKPIPLTEKETEELFNRISSVTETKLKGSYLDVVRKSNAFLASPPLGYKWNNGRLVIKRNESLFVEKIFDYYINTKSLRKTREKLISSGLIKFKGNRPKIGLTENSIRDILNNDFYANKLISAELFNLAKNTLNGKNLI